MLHTHRRPLTVVCLALTLVACSDPGSTLETVPPTTSSGAAGTTTTATTVADTTPGGTDAAVTTAATTEPVTATTLALTEGPWTVVTSIPEVTEPGLYYELSLPGLYAYFPTKISEDDQVFWTMNDADRPVIEAYLHAQLTINQSMLTRPMDFTLAGWDQYFADGGASLIEIMQPRSDDDLALNVDLGIVLRPWVIDDGRTETTATVVDCVQNGSVLQRSDGSFGPSSSPGWGVNAYAAEMVLTDGQWQVKNLSYWDDACALFGP